MRYSLLVEGDILPGRPVVFWGYGIFHCNINDPKYRGTDFAILYAREANPSDPEHRKFMIGYAKKKKSVGDAILWDPEKNTEDLIVQAGPDHAPLLKVPALPENVYIPMDTQEEQNDPG